MSRSTTFQEAIRHSGAYFARYCIVGALPALLFALNTSSLAAGLLIYALQALSGFLLVPGAILVNYAGLRLAPDRSWEREPARAWIAGALATAFVWTAGFIVVANSIEPPQVMRQLFGTDWAWVLHVTGIHMLASSAALGITWILHPWHRRREFAARAPRSPGSMGG